MTIRKVALTGGIATGKSYVLKRFKDMGLPTIDVDQVSREVVAVGQPALDDIERRFGPEFLLPNGELDRNRVAKVIFNDEVERIELERIIHPRVRVRLDQWFSDLEEEGIAGVGVAAIPLLYETGQDARFDLVIVTSCESKIQLSRLMVRDGFCESDATKRLGCQMDTAEKMARADFVIQTDGSFESTDQQIESILSEMLSA